MTIRRRVAEIFPGEPLRFVLQIDQMVERFDHLPDQRPSTCGAFALSYLLPAIGFSEHDGRDLAAEDYLAHLASVVVEAWEIGSSEAISAKVRRGELSEDEALRHHAESWYRWPVRSSADSARQGTAPEGIARAVAVGTDGAMATLPVPGRTPNGLVQLTPERWEALLSLLHENLEAWRLHAILNYQADLLLDPRSPEYRPELLRDPAALELIPRDNWGVGHFAGLAGIGQRPDRSWWLILLDTYKERGFDGYQPQPGELVRRGLVREDGRHGGILLVVPREVVPPLAASLDQLELALAMWDNGSPPPDDWRWQLGR